MTAFEKSNPWVCAKCGKRYPVEILAAQCGCPMLKSERPYKTKTFVQLMREGFFFCVSCQCITELRDVDESQHHCALCNSPRVRWVEPVPF